MEMPQPHYPPLSQGPQSRADYLRYYAPYNFISELKFSAGLGFLNGIMGAMLFGLLGTAGAVAGGIGWGWFVFSARVFLKYMEKCTDRRQAIVRLPWRQPWTWALLLFTLPWFLVWIGSFVRFCIDWKHMRTALAGR